MFVPYSTDAPLYYAPFATLALIVLNVTVFFSMAAGELGDVSGYLLLYGQGLHPLQWITSSFLHASLGHLVGNMFFLWAFGLVVEGKLGWWRMLACYLGISLVQGALEQTVMLGYDGISPGSLGASAVIFGLMALAVVWAPKNDLKCFLFFGLLFFFDVAILGFATFYICLQMISIYLANDASSWLHISGFVVGLPLGIVLLKKDIVDCEGWDIFHVLNDDYGSFQEEPDAEEIAAQLAQRQQRKDEKLLADARDQFRVFLNDNNAPAALKLLEKMQAVGDGLVLDQAELTALIQRLHAAECWTESAPWLAQCIERFPDRAAPLRIKLAQICVVHLQRPGRAIDLLRPLRAADLSEKQVTLVKKIAARARQMQQQGILELDDHDW